MLLREGERCAPVAEVPLLRLVHLSLQLPEAEGGQHLLLLLGRHCTRQNAARRLLQRPQHVHQQAQLGVVAAAD
jgi:hypothetical protein